MRRLMLVILGAGCLAPAAHAWTWPARGPVLRPFSFSSGNPYAGGQHRGIDVGADAAAPVLAPAAGTVTFAGSVPSGGRTVTIETSDGYAVTLVHLGSVDVSRGAAVEEGAPVGTIGPSGDAEIDQPYVHLGIRVAADSQGYVDPLGLLPPPEVVPEPLPDPVPKPAPPPPPPPPPPAVPPEPVADPDPVVESEPSPPAVEVVTVEAPPAPVGVPAAPGVPVVAIGEAPPLARPQAAPAQPTPATVTATSPEPATRTRPTAAIAAALSVDAPARPDAAATHEAVAAQETVAARTTGAEAGAGADAASPATSRLVTAGARSTATPTVRPDPVVESASSPVRVVRETAAPSVPPAARARPRLRLARRAVAVVVPRDARIGISYKEDGASSQPAEGAVPSTGRPLHVRHTAAPGPARPMAGGGGHRPVLLLLLLAIGLAALLGTLCRMMRRAAPSRRARIMSASVADLDVPGAAAALEPDGALETRAETHPRRCRVALRRGTAAHRAHGGIRRSFRHLRSLPPPARERRAHGERNRRARHAGDGRRRSRGSVVP